MKNCRKQLKLVALISAFFRKGRRTSLPWAFTESGIYMLMTVLRGDLATSMEKLNS
jgi:hypothetical protein